MFLGWGQWPNLCSCGGVMTSPPTLHETLRLGVADMPPRSRRRIRKPIAVWMGRLALVFLIAAALGCSIFGAEEAPPAPPPPPPPPPPPAARKIESVPEVNFEKGKATLRPEAKARLD